MLRRRGRPRPTSLIAAAVIAGLVLSLGSFTTLGATLYTPKCDKVNLRTGPSTSYVSKVKVNRGAQLTVVGTVSGGSYGTSCNGKWLSGSGWHKISAIDGRSVKTLYGVSYLYGASKLFKAVTTSTTPSPSPTATAAPLASPEPSTSPAPTPAPSAEPSLDPSPTDDPEPTDSPSPEPTASPPGPITLPDTITFYGRGWGHGVGMSQYGAHGRALDGQSAATILSHYYKNTTKGSIGNPTVRVLVLNGFAATSSNPLQVYGRGGSWSIDGISKTFPADARLRLIPTTSDGTTTWKAIVNDAGGATLHSASISAKFVIRPGSGASLQLWSKPSAYDRFRGTLRVIASTGSAATVRVVNHLSLENYLRGVVPAEVSAAWPVEAIKAQAIAARSYAARRLHPDTGQFDLYDDTRHQVYRGLLAEKAGTNSAIKATAGVIRLAPNGTIANTLFHSTGGGATEHNENVFTSSTGEKTAGVVKYLRGSLDRRSDGTSYDSASRVATWRTETYSLSQIQSWYGSDSRTSVGTLVALDLTNRGVSGRLISVTLIGASGATKTVSGAVFISIFNAKRPSGDRQLRSTLFDFAPIP